MEAEIRILSIGNFGHGWDGSICDEEHIAGALEELGHEVTRLQREEASIGTFYDSLMHQAPDFYDFVLVAQWDGYLPGIFGNWRKAMAGTKHVEKIVYWAFDYQADGQEWHERLISQADLYLSKRIADSKYPNWQYLSQDFAPAFLDKYRNTHYPGNWPEKDIDVLFTGSYLDWATERNDTIKAVNEKFKLVIHSINGWPDEWGLDVRPPIMDEGLPELYARAKVILSIDHTIEAGYWSDRNAQIMACGYRPLFRYVPLSEATFHNDVDYFYSVEDCLDQIGFRLKGLLPPILEETSYRAGRRLTVISRVADLLTIVKGIL